MTVAELIKALQNMPQDAVVLTYDECCNWCDLETVEQTVMHAWSLHVEDGKCIRSPRVTADSRHNVYNDRPDKAGIGLLLQVVRLS